MVFDNLYLGVDGFFFLLGLLHTAQTSIEGLVGLVKLILLLFCLLQLYLRGGWSRSTSRYTQIKSHRHTHTPLHMHIYKHATTTHAHTTTYKCVHTHAHSTHAYIPPPTHPQTCLSSSAPLRSSRLPTTTLTHLSTILPSPPPPRDLKPAASDLSASMELQGEVELGRESIGR